MYYDTSDIRKYGELEGKTFLIVAGAMKCATSWVYHYLGALSGVEVSPLKELHFFDSKFHAHALGDMDALAIKRVGLHLNRSGDPVENLLFSEDYQASIDRMQMVYDDNAYFLHFTRLCAPDTKTLCDVTPAYSTIGPDGFEFMKLFLDTQNVRARVVFIMRDPVDRLWSQLRHLQEINPKGEAATRWAEAIASPRICARADYAGTVADIDGAFPPQDILYLFYEDLFTEATLRRLSDFAGAPYRPGDTEARKNHTRVALDLPEDARTAFLDLLAPQYAFCHDRFDAQLPASWLA